jgi:hypothetical protein
MGEHRLRSRARSPVLRYGQRDRLVPPLRGGGDNLYTACIVAVHASIGELAWYFQPTPGDNWDYDATQTLMQADLKIGGRIRKVLMQANKNGFFCLLDRRTGEFISGAPFVSGITWTSGLDRKTGRPVDVPGLRGAEPTLVSPGPFGAHNWYPMAFHPATGLVYVPAKSGAQMVHAPDPKWKYNPNAQNLGMDGTYEGPLYAKSGTQTLRRDRLLSDGMRQSELFAPHPSKKTSVNSEPIRSP